jgi:hypothetical protein
MERFRLFYVDHFRAEHQHPANIALHLLGVVLSAALVVAAIASGQLWLALAYPVVHGAPGLLGHRLLERHAAIGDLRITRDDFPLWWFIIANHLLCAEVLLGRRLFSRTRSEASGPGRAE